MDEPQRKTEEEVYDHSRISSPTFSRATREETQERLSKYRRLVEEKERKNSFSSWLRNKFSGFIFF